LVIERRIGKRILFDRVSTEVTFLNRGNKSIYPVLVATLPCGPDSEARLTANGAAVLASVPATFWREPASERVLGIGSFVKVADLGFK
jgi:hypothetical protein